MIRKNNNKNYGKKKNLRENHVIEGSTLWTGYRCVQDWVHVSVQMCDIVALYNVLLYLQISRYHYELELQKSPFLHNNVAVDLLLWLEEKA